MARLETSPTLFPARKILAHDLRNTWRAEPRLCGTWWLVPPRGTDGGFHQKLHTPRKGLL
jgi:hypothetical protein